MTNTKGRDARNGTIELWRFVFALLIVFCHGELLGAGKLLFPSGAIGVEFFFLVSGFLMAKSVEKMPPLAKEGHDLGRETLQYVGKKIKALCPNYYVAWIIAFTVYSIAQDKTAPLLLAQTFVKCIYELLFLTFSGLVHLRMNGAVWYLHAMLLVMFILYPLLRKYYEFFVHVIAPVVAILFLGYMMKTFGHLRSPTDWLGWTYKGNFRAVAELCMGISLYPWSQKIKEIPLTKFSRVLVSIVEHGGYIGLLVCAARPKASNFDFLFLLFSAVAIMLSFSEQGVTFKLYQNQVSIWLGEFSLSLYLSHVFYAKQLSTLLPNLNGNHLIILYFVLAIGTALFVMYISKALKAWVPGLGRRFKYLFVMHQ